MLESIFSAIFKSFIYFIRIKIKMMEKNKKQDEMIKGVINLIKKDLIIVSENTTIQFDSKKLNQLPDKCIGFDLKILFSKSAIISKEAVPNGLPYSESFHLIMKNLYGGKEDSYIVLQNEGHSQKTKLEVSYPVKRELSFTVFDDYFKVRVKEALEKKGSS